MAICPFAFVSAETKVDEIGFFNEFELPNTLYAQITSDTEFQPSYYIALDTGLASGMRFNAGFSRSVIEFQNNQQENKRSKINGVDLGFSGSPLETWNHDFTLSYWRQDELIEARSIATGLNWYHEYVAMRLGYDMNWTHFQGDNFSYRQIGFLGSLYADIFLPLDIEFSIGVANQKFSLNERALEIIKTGISNTQINNPALQSFLSRLEDKSAQIGFTKYFEFFTISAVYQVQELLIFNDRFKSLYFSVDYDVSPYFTLSTSLNAAADVFELNSISFGLSYAF